METNCNTTKIQNFWYQKQRIRVVQKDGEPWFVLKDVCAVLGHTNPSVILSRLDKDEWAKKSLGQNSNYKREGNIVSESGLYRIIMTSNKANAKPFTRWVTHDVLPSIRKHGFYTANNKIEANERNVQILMNVIDDVRGLNDKLKEQTQKLIDKIKADQPKVTFADALANSEKCILVRELAKILSQNGVNMGEKRLFEKLREDGFLIKKKGSDHNMPTQKAMELHLFKTVVTTIIHSDGVSDFNYTPKVTVKGQQYFLNYFLNAPKQLNLITDLEA